jgi:hypothetical protein
MPQIKPIERYWIRSCSQEGMRGSIQRIEFIWSDSTYLIQSAARAVPETAEVTVFSRLLS